MIESLAELHLQSIIEGKLFELWNSPSPRADIGIGGLSVGSAIEVGPCGVGDSDRGDCFDRWGFLWLVHTISGEVVAGLLHGVVFYVRLFCVRLPANIAIFNGLYGEHRKSVDRHLGEYDFRDCVRGLDWQCCTSFQTMGGS